MRSTTHLPIPTPRVRGFKDSRGVNGGFDANANDFLSELIQVFVDRTNREQLVARLLENITEEWLRQSVKEQMSVKKTQCSLSRCMSES